MQGKDRNGRSGAHHELEIGILLVAIVLIVLVTLAGKLDLSFLF